LEFISGRRFLIAGLEKELEGKKAGDKFSAVIPPAEAYGEYSEQLKFSVPKTQFDTDVEIEVGMQFQAGMGQIVTVKEVKEKEVVIDANHPLAGETLYFDVEILSVRAATSEEIAAILAPRGGCGGGCGGCGGGCGDDCNCDDDCSCGGCVN
jgi:FKBP-type peptidyl-prolyl cis-trans isomerase SlyD